jgi:chromosome segregation ATPase
MKRLLFVLIALLVVLGGACAPAPSREGVSGIAPAAPLPAQPPEARGVVAEAGRVSDQQLQEARKVIYNAGMVLIVRDTEAAARQVAELATSLGGYVADMNGYRGSDNILRYTITLRVPAEQFDAARAALRALAVRVENETLNTNDVTDQYYDLEARLRVLRATENELLDLLRETRERGGKVEDIMAIYRELTSVQGEIESLQGQLNRLEKLVALSTITVELRPYELIVPVTTEEWTPLQTVRESFGTLVQVLRGLVDLLIRLVVIVVPVLLILALPVIVVLLLLRAVIRRRRGRQQV